MSKCTLVASGTLALLPEGTRLSADECLVGRLMRWEGTSLFPSVFAIAVASASVMIITVVRTITASVVLVGELVRSSHFDGV
jgi:hypothetical protein